MKSQNIALPDDLKPKLVRIKWHLWREKTENALKRLDSLIDDCPKTYKQRLEKLKAYIPKFLQNASFEETWVHLHNKIAFYITLPSIISSRKYALGSSVKFTALAVN